MLLIECLAVALVLASCGGGDDPAPNRLRSEPDAGDEQPISVDVRVRLGDDDVTVAPKRVAAFLPLRFVVTNTGGAPASVRITGVGRRRVADREVLRSPGLQPGPVRVISRGGVAVLTVASGG